MQRVLIPAQRLRSRIATAFGLPLAMLDETVHGGGLHADNHNSERIFAQTVQRMATIVSDAVATAVDAFNKTYKQRLSSALGCAPSAIAFKITASTLTTETALLLHASGFLSPEAAREQLAAALGLDTCDLEAPPREMTLEAQGTLMVDSEGSATAPKKSATTGKRKSAGSGGDTKRRA